MSGPTSKLLLAGAISLSFLVSPGISYADRAESSFSPLKRNFRSNSGSNTFFIFGGLGGSYNRRPKVNLPVARTEPTKIYTYRPDPLVRLEAPNLKQPRQSGPLFSRNDGAPVEVSLQPAAPLDDSLAQTVFTSLKRGAVSMRVTAAQKKAIIHFYKSRNYAPLWTSLDGLNAKGAELLAILSRADEEGLDASHYLPPVLGSFDDSLDDIESDISLLARLEIGLTVAAVRYGMDASGGRIIPNRLSGFHDLNPPVVKPETLLAQLAQSDAPSAYLSSLHPQSAAYRAFKAELARQRKAIPEAAFEPVPNGPVIRPGSSDPRLALIRKRLIKAGYLERSASQPEENADTPDSLYYDDDMVQAVRDFQRANNLKPDGIIGSRTIAKFNGARKVNRLRALILNMERLRWLPRRFPPTYLFANQAAFDLRVVRNNKLVWKTKVIVGKPTNQTSFFIDQMETVVFNPYWGVPQSIMRNEMLPRLINNPGYLDRRGFEVYNSRGKRISSSRVDWWNYGGGGVIPFSVRQPPSGKNALGRIKFLFPNKHSIYMHDTPSKQLFNSSTRAFSHGCVRVYKPRVLAEKVLGWGRDEIDSKIATGKNTKVSLPRKIPVYLTYFTAWPDSSGKIHYYKDIYGRDARLELALGSTRIASR